MNFPHEVFAAENEQFVVAFLNLDARGQDACAPRRARPSPSPVASFLDFMDMISKWTDSLIVLNTCSYPARTASRPTNAGACWGMNRLAAESERLKTTPGKTEGPT